VELGERHPHVALGQPNLADDPQEFALLEGVLIRIALTLGELAGTADDVVELSAREAPALVRTHLG